ncbi:MAG: cysteine desulfurase [Alphaproteobacteria bacterium]|nr:cysteine desulfurase [Alphaproteobacteria bacterium]
MDVLKIRKDFPILERKMRGQPLVYLDSAASAQKPRPVIEAMSRFYEQGYANIHRGVYELSMSATDLYDQGRVCVQRFINAAHEDEIIFTHGATESLNLVASSWGAANLKEGDEVVLTQLEHHANIVPWQLLQKKIPFKLRVVPIKKDGDILLQDVLEALSEKTKLVSVAHVSNAFGTILPVKDIIKAAHDRGIPVMLDGAQAIAHETVDVQALDADFYVFSGHKIYGPTGIGVLYGKRAWLQSMPPYQGGGDMIENVTFEETSFLPPPARFEAGTPHIAGVVGLTAGLNYVTSIGMQNIAVHEDKLLAYAHEKIGTIQGVRLIGTAPRKAAILSFVMEHAHPHDIGTVLESRGIAIRAGHHCAQPAMESMGLMGTARASFGLYNTFEDVDSLAEGLRAVREIFA